MSAPAKPGRPRDPHTDTCIISAALRVLAQHGYSRMTLDLVAQEAGVSRPTIYRRYANKAELAMAALNEYRQRDTPQPSGDMRSDLIAHLRHFQQGLSRPNGMAMLGSVLAEEYETPQLLAIFREQIIAQRRQALRSILQYGQQQGDLHPDADIEVMIAMIIGSFYAQYLAHGPFAADWPERVTATLLKM